MGDVDREKKAQVKSGDNVVNLCQYQCTHGHMEHIQTFNANKYFISIIVPQ